MSDIPALSRSAWELALKGLDDYQVAKRLFDPNAPVRSSYAVARALHHKKGLGLPLGMVARALHDEKGADIQGWEVATVLHDDKGLGLPLETVAKALHHKAGANLSPAGIAKALAFRHGLAVPPHKLVPAVAAITSSDEALFEATVPLVRSGYHRPEDHLALMDALLHHLPTERSLPLLAKAMLAGEQPIYSPETLARLLAAEDGLDLPPQSVVYALSHHDGPRLPPEQVASILTDDSVLGLRPNAATEALACGAGLDQREARRIVGDGMESGQVPVLQRDEGELKLARAVPTNRLVR